MIRSGDLQVPEIAWPTLGVLALVMAGSGLALAAGTAGWLPPLAAAALATASAFAAFTPLHDGVHGSVSRHRWVNDLTGRLGGMVLGGSFAAFRHSHLEHHRHTNEPGLDPDLWSGQGPAVFLPLRWLTQEARHYALYVGIWERRPFLERLDFLLTNGALAVAAAWLWRAGLGWEVLAFWFLPGRVAAGLLAFSFDFLPHQPHRMPSAVDRYRATHVLTDPPLTPLFLYQNYHLIHHLYPGVPFYRYARIWRARREVLLARGAREIRLIPPLYRLPVTGGAAGLRSIT